MNVAGAVSVVTGGNGGLGRRIAGALADAGSDVALVCRSSIDETRELAGELAARGVLVTAYAADLSDAAAVDDVFDRVVHDFGRVDVLVNNAAVNRFVAFEDLDALTPDLWDELLRTNATGPFLCSRRAAAAMRGGGGGRIVNVSSIAGFAPQGSSIAYAVSKAALNHLTRCLAVALAPDEVLVNGVAPGHMEHTRMSARLPPERTRRSIADAALKRSADRDDVAAQVLTFVRSDSTTGQTVCVDAGRVFP